MIEVIIIGDVTGPSILFIGNDTGGLALTSALTNSVHRYPSFSAFKNSGLASPDGIVLALADETEAVDIAMAIRQDEALWLLPVYSCVSVDTQSLLYPLIDGVVSTLDAAIQSAAAINERTGQLSIDPTLDIDNRVLAFLASRPEGVLRPIPFWQSPRLYRYPLLEALGGRDIDCWAWLGRLQNRGWLTRVKLIDRVRDCKQCGAAHQVFVDTCPNCHDLDIQQVPFIHCFTCGNVAPQRDFMATGRLTCARCQTKLRHIGSDYDRPLEDHECQVCHFAFSEPEVIARCAHCDHRQTPSDLVVRDVLSMTVSDQGRLVAEYGRSQDLLDVFDQVNFARPSVFRFSLDWMLALEHRHAALEFSVVLLRIRDIQKLIDSIGPARVSMLLHGFADRLRDLIRTTDVCTRTSENQFWLLLPFTDGKAGSGLLERLKTFQQQTQQSSGVSLELDIEFFASDLVEDPPHEAEVLMAEMTGRLE